MATMIEPPPRTPDISLARRRAWKVTPGAALFALAAVLIAGLSARDAAVFVMANRNPELAVKLAPANATAIVRVFDKTVARSGEWQTAVDGWVAASRQALRADPLNARGVRLLAYVTQLAPGGQPRARALMQLSERVSRRDSLAQIWLIEDAVQRDNIAGALIHYDRALTVRPALGGQLIPILASASSDPAIQRALVPYLRANRSWVIPLLSVAIAKSPDPVAIARLFQRYGGARTVPAHAELETQMLNRLVQDGKTVEGREFASAMGAGVKLNAFDFNPVSTDARFRPLAWSLYDGTDGEVSLGPQGELSIELRSEAKILAASRIILPSSREMNLRQRVTYADPASAPLITWRAFCRRPSGPQLFWTRSLPVASGATIIQAPISIPDKCNGVQTDLEITGPQGAAESTVKIDSVELAAR